VNINFFDYNKLRRIWQYEFLISLKASMPNIPETSQLIDNLLKTYGNGFYDMLRRRCLAQGKPPDTYPYCS